MAGGVAAMSLLDTDYPLVPNMITFEREKTKAYVSDCLRTIKDYKRHGMISAELYENTKKEIKAAPHDDALADIMMRVRRNINW